MKKQCATRLFQSLPSLLSLSLAVITVLLCTAQRAPAQEPNWILHHGKIITVDANFSAWTNEVFLGVEPDG